MGGGGKRISLPELCEILRISMNSDMGTLTERDEGYPSLRHGAMRESIRRTGYVRLIGPKWWKRTVDKA